METKQIEWEDLGVKAELSAFEPEDGVGEFHVILHVRPNGESFELQLKRLKAGEQRLMAMAELEGAIPVMERYFLSDAANQYPCMEREEKCACSVIQQPPLDGSKVGLWIYLQRGTNVYQEKDVWVAEHNGYRHLWKMGMQENNGNSFEQTQHILYHYADILKEFDATLAENCIRTWFFVRDVDILYAGMVKARRYYFFDHGLSEKTHYIASTGIGGVPADTGAIIQFGAYALQGFEPEQQRYLYAPTHLNPTYEYGVTFERGTRLEFGDRLHVIISGTASINNKGEVMYEGDVISQTRRMWENVGTLLKEGGASYDDVAHIVVYLRDMADYECVSAMFAERFTRVPYIITQAPVCRPKWLVEMECMAIVPNNNPKYKSF